MNASERIRRRLEDAFQPSRLEVHDESARHAGHAGARAGGETHFRVTIVSQTFAGRSRLERHRLVHAALDEELRGGVHALALTALVPGEEDTLKG